MQRMERRRHWVDALCTISELLNILEEHDYDLDLPLVRFAIASARQQMEQVQGSIRAEEQGHPAALLVSSVVGCLTAPDPDRLKVFLLEAYQRIACGTPANLVSHDVM